MSEDKNYNPVVRPHGRRRAPRVAFGLALQTIFREHGITRQEDMARVIREGGYHNPIKQNTISNWMTGESEPKRPWKLAAALEEALPMTLEQWKYLSLALFAPRVFLKHYYPWLVS